MTAARVSAIPLRYPRRSSKVAAVLYLRFFHEPYRIELRVRLTT